jgi:hypothetical protein
MKSWIPCCVMKNSKAATIAIIDVAAANTTRYGRSIRSSRPVSVFRLGGGATALTRAMGLSLSLAIAALRKWGSSGPRSTRQGPEPDELGYLTGA